MVWILVSIKKLVVKFVLLFRIGVLIGFSIVLSSYCVTVALFVCYITTSKATKFRDDLKRNFEVDFKEGGQRNWIQIVCNLGVACNFILLRLLYFGSGEIEIDFSEQKKYWNSWLLVSSLSAISCALGDTLSSELGSVFCDEPVSVITWNVVPKGTNGGVSIAGFVSATIGGFLIGTSSFISLYTTTISTENVNHTAQWPIIFFCIYASLIGSIIDSILGATLQYTGYDHWRKKIVETPPPLGVEQNCHIEHISGYDLLDNHGVNLLSILIISLINPFFAGYLWPYGTNIFL